MSEKFEKILAMHCSPALLGIKSANLINCSLLDFPNLYEELEELNCYYGSRIIFKILKIVNNKALVLVYQEKKLFKTVFGDRNYDFLLKKGYPISKNINLYLELLSSRMSDINSFPHEIGVFLGYDLDDIMDFESGQKECLHVGYWKVFSNKEEKLQIFNRFTRCRNLINRLLDKGYRLQAII